MKTDSSQLQLFLALGDDALIHSKATDLPKGDSEVCADQAAENIIAFQAYLKEEQDMERKELIVEVLKNSAHLRAWG